MNWQEAQTIDATIQDYQAMCAMVYDWRNWARRDQLPPDGDWNIWLILSGRGWGKTRTGAQTIIEWARNGTRRMHLVARTAADVRDTMIEGESGIMAISSPDFKPVWKPSTRKIIWPNGAIATTFSAEEPDQLRGPQCEKFWADELASWKYEDAWDQLQFGCRLGNDTRGVVTTTPRPVPVIKSLVKRKDCTITRGSTWDNADNLSGPALEALREQYEGTRLGRQELEGHILDDNPNALFRRADLDRDRVTKIPCDIVYVVVAIDPSVTATGDECGIVVAARGSDNHYYLIEDCSLQAAPAIWARQAMTAYHKHVANKIVYESNQGGQMVAQTLRLYDNVPVQGVHASKGKRVRAEPISMLSEQGKIHHVGNFAKLEDELCEWEPDTNESPNRLDAYVWAISFLSKRQQSKAFIV